LEVTKSESFIHIHCQLKEESHRKFEIQPSTQYNFLQIDVNLQDFIPSEKKGGAGETQGRETKGGKEIIKENGTVLYLTIW
jgi:hypothetical protein